MRKSKNIFILLCFQLLCLFCFGFVEDVSANDKVKIATDLKVKESAIFKTIKNAKSYIVMHQNTDGGWPLLPGGKSDAEVTALAIWALTDAGWGTGSRIIRRGVRYLKNQQREDGSWNNNTAHTAFALIALSNAKADADTQFNGLQWLKNAQNPIGSWGRKNKGPGHVLYTSATLVGFKKLGFTERHFKPILPSLEWLAEQNNFENVWNLPGGTQSDIYVTSWVLHGMSPDRKYDETVYDLDEQIAWVKQFQNRDGGFPRFNGRPSDPEVTATAIMAFAAYNDPLNTRRVAISYLTKVQEADGGYISSIPIELKSPTANLQTTCFVLIAIYSKTDGEQ